MAFEKENIMEKTLFGKVTGFSDDFQDDTGRSLYFEFTISLNCNTFTFLCEAFDDVANEVADNVKVGDYIYIRGSWNFSCGDYGKRENLMEFMVDAIELDREYDPADDPENYIENEG